MLKQKLEYDSSLSQLPDWREKFQFWVLLWKYIYIQHQIIELFFPSTFVHTLLTFIYKIHVQMNYIKYWFGIYIMFCMRMKRKTQGNLKTWGLYNKASRDRQQQVETYHWSNWSHPSQAHTDRCLEQCSGHGHIYQHSGLSERKSIK